MDMWQSCFPSCCCLADGAVSHQLVPVQGSPMLYLSPLGSEMGLAGEEPPEQVVIPAQKEIILKGREGLYGGSSAFFCGLKWFQHHAVDESVLLSCGCRIPESVQGQLGQGLEQVV